jgi:hypothetical protein
MTTPGRRLSRYLQFAAFGLLFAGLCAIASVVGANDRAMLGAGLGLVGAGLALSLAAGEALRQPPEPPEL